MGNLSEHWNKEELACHCGCGLFVRNAKLIELIERIRSYVDIPLTCNSSTRCLYNNAKAGGVVSKKIYIPNSKPPKLDLTKYPKGKPGTSKDSNHTTGEAADLSTPILKSLDLYARILEMYKKNLIPNLGGIGLYISKNFVHVDVTKAANGQLRTWTEK
jgi:hypothetical protein